MGSIHPAWVVERRKEDPALCLGVTFRMSFTFYFNFCSLSLGILGYLYLMQEDALFLRLWLRYISSL